MAKGPDSIDYIVREIDKRESFIRTSKLKVRSAKNGLSELARDVLEDLQEAIDEAIDEVRDLRERLQAHIGE